MNCAVCGPNGEGESVHCQVCNMEYCSDCYGQVTSLIFVEKLACLATEVDTKRKVVEKDESCHPGEIRCMYCGVWHDTGGGIAKVLRVRR